MSNRERWIIYPLLFMTLGMTIRGRVLEPINRTPGVKVHQVDALDIQCRSFSITDDDGATRLRLGVAPDGAGQLVIYEPGGKVVSLVGMNQANQSGLVEVFGPDQQVGAYVGFRQDEPGVFVDVAGSGRRNMRLTSPVDDWLKLVRDSLKPSEPEEAPR